MMSYLFAFLHEYSTKEHSQVLSSNLVSLEKREEVLQDKLGSLENQHVQDASRLRTQLDQAQAHTHTLQKEVHTFSFYLLNTQVYKKYNLVPAQGCNKANCERNISLFKVPQQDDFVCVCLCVCSMKTHSHSFWHFVSVTRGQRRRS